MSAQDNKKSNKLLEKLSKGPVICAEGYGMELERRGYLQQGSFVPTCVLEHPDAVKALHHEFVRCGTDVIEAMTYFGHRKRLSNVDQENQCTNLNRKAVELAMEVRNEYPDLDLLVAASLSKSTLYIENDLKNDEYIKLLFSEQVEVFAEMGVDYLIAETFDFVGEAVLALEVIQKYKLPSVITLSWSQRDLSRDGYSIEDAMKLLSSKGATVVGLNCSRGPDTLMPLLKRARAAVENNCVIAGLPVCYRTNEKETTWLSFKNMKDSESKFLKLDCHTCTRYDLANFGKECIENNINYIGTCCGGAPHHIRSMAEALGRQTISSKYSPDLTKDPIFGSEQFTRAIDRDEKDFK